MAVTTWLRFALRELAARAVVCEPVARWLARCYRALPDAAAGAVHARWAKLFVGHHLRSTQETEWRVDFAGRPLMLPLRARHLAVDWDDLLSLRGAELEVKRFYRDLLTGPERPEVFVDGGASYGTHTLIFAAHGVPVIAFEPNPECHPTFERLMRPLARAPRLFRAALGERAGRAALWFPADLTWLGAIAEHAPDGPGPWKQHAVDVVALDDLRAAIPPGRLFIKLDLEGGELAALRGAVRMLAERRPLLLVEIQPGPQRERVHRQLVHEGYRIERLPARRTINFLARPS